MSSHKNIFASIASAKPLFGTPEKVETIESAQPSEIVTRLKIATQAKLSLAEKIKLRRLAFGYKSKGLEKLLDLTPLEQGELLIFCRKGSMLVAKIDQIKKFRTPEEALKAMLLTTVKGFCRMCYESCHDCICPDEVRDWV